MTWWQWLLASPWLFSLAVVLALVASIPRRH